MNDPYEQQMEDVIAECSEPNWDSFDAYVINLKSVARANELMGLYGLMSIPAPYIVPFPSGNVGLEWGEWDGKVSTLLVVFVGSTRMDYIIEINGDTFETGEIELGDDPIPHLPEKIITHIKHCSQQ